MVCHQLACCGHGPWVVLWTSGGWKCVAHCRLFALGKSPKIAVGMLGKGAAQPKSGIMVIYSNKYRWWSWFYWVIEASSTVSRWRLNMQSRPWPRTRVASTCGHCRWLDAQTRHLQPAHSSIWKHRPWPKGFAKQRAMWQRMLFWLHLVMTCFDTPFRPIFLGSAMRSSPTGLIRGPIFALPCFELALFDFVSCVSRISHCAQKRSVSHTNTTTVHSCDSGFQGCRL